VAGDGWDEELDVEFQLPKGGAQRVAVPTLFLNSPNLIRSLLPQNGKNEDALEHPETFPREFLAIYCNSSPCAFRKTAPNIDVICGNPPSGSPLY